MSELVLRRERFFCGSFAAVRAFVWPLKGKVW